MDKNNPSKKQGMDLKSLQETSLKVIKSLVRKSKIIFLLVMLSLVLYSAYSIVTTINSEPEKSEAEAVSKPYKKDFNQKVIDKVKSLSRRDENSNIVLPPGRTNPFNE